MTNPPLSLERRVELLTGSGVFTTHAEPALGLHELRMSDGPTGVRGIELSQQSALLPNATLLASAWDEGLMAEVGALLAAEARRHRIHVLLGPTVNLHRTLLGGRLFEMYSEDPLLTGRLAAAYIRALQAGGVASCLKHYVANESETDRTSVSSEVDEATLRELYLLPFEITVDDANPWAIMAAYNDVNGVPASEHPFLLQQVLRDEWGWDGVVISDWGATKSAGPAAAAGMGLVMPGPVGPWGDALVHDVRSGRVPESVIDQHLARLQLLGERVGSPAAPEGVTAGHPSEHKDALIRLAAAGMTVLTNDGTLPLTSGTSVALIGRHAIDTVAMGGGSAEVRAPYHVSIAQGLGERHAQLTVLDGVEVRSRLAAAPTEAVVDPVTGKPGIRVRLLASDGTVVGDEHVAAARGLLGGEATAIELTAEIACEGPVDVGVIGVGDWDVTVGQQTAAISLRSSGLRIGEEGIAPPAGVVVPSASGGELIRAVSALLPCYPAGEVFGLWGLALKPCRIDEEERIRAAVDAAREADVAVVVVGLTEEQETESLDKTTLSLPGRQDELVSRVAAVARKTVVVVNAATPVLMPWLDQVAAVLHVGFPGQEGGHAVARALLGDVEPTGRLVTTFPVADGAAPAWSVVPAEGKVVYREGAFVGHRGHLSGAAPEPLFWFGHGLGYGDWEYGEASRDDDGSVSVTVTNVGSRPSREVVQVYFRPDDASLPTRLVGWGSAVVEPGAKAEVRVVPDPRAMRRWDGGWHPLERGELLVGRSAGDIRSTAR